MRNLSVFNNVSLDGFFTGPKGELDWAHTKDQDPEWSAFIAENSNSESPLLFGRITYEMMAGYWPTPMAKQNMPELSARMNALPKIVFSRTMTQATWNNTRLIKGDLAKEVRKLKAEPGADMVILGSGSMVSQLAQEGLIDGYQMVLTPVVIGKGRTMFEGLKQNLELKLKKTRSFGNGNIVLWYEP